MPRHPPIALKTLDRSHCQCPSAQSEGLSLQPNPYGISVRTIPKELSPEADPVRDQTSMSLAQKDQLLEIGSRVRLGKPIICGRLSVSRDKSQHYCHEVRTNLLFTMSNRTSGKLDAHHKPFLRMTFFLTSHLYSTPLPGDNPCGLHARQTATRRLKRQSCGLRKWWSRTGSNRRHPACKAGALPAELRPLIPFVEEIRQSLRIAKWWAWEDLNLRPHAYQARALTN